MSMWEEWFVRGTACAAFLCYAVALLRKSRASWMAGALVMLVHMLGAFHFAHDWSHGVAVEATAAQSAAITGIRAGGGIWMNYLVVLVWLADGLWWLFWPENRARRPRVVNILLHGFLAFMWFNATVVFGHGVARWGGAVVWGLLAWCYRRRE